jgi:hypothetical protein
MFFALVAVIGAVLRNEKRKKSGSDPIDVAMGALAGEEEDLLSCTDPQTAKFLIPWKGVDGAFLCFFSSILLDGMVVWMLCVDEFQQEYGNQPSIQTNSINNLFHNSTLLHFIPLYSTPLHSTPSLYCIHGIIIHSLTL